MHFLIVIALAFFAFASVLLVAGVFIKKEYTIIQDIVIDKPVNDVFGYVKFMKNQQFFSKWWMTDPNSKKTYAGIDGTEGFITTWDSQNKQAGKGEQKMIKITPHERVDYEIRFERPFKGVAYSYITTIGTTPATTKVTWVFFGTNKYPMNLMSALLKLNQMLANDLQLSLQNLKAIMEK